jgi:hypothetical protein
MTPEDVLDLFFVRTPLELEAVSRIVREERSTDDADTPQLDDAAPLRRDPGGPVPT